MLIAFSLAKVSEDLLWTRYSDHLDPLEMKHMCKKIFGNNVDLTKSPIATLKGRSSSITFAPSGTDGVVCLYNDRVLKEASDFTYVMKPMPVRTPFGAGDFFLAIEIDNRNNAYLVWSKAKDQLVYFPNIDALQDYYETLGVSPGVDRMKAFPSRRLYGK